MYKLIIVDDETPIRKGLVSHFPWNELGFEVAADFSNARHALDYIEEHEVHAVLTDIKMPIMNGIEFTKVIYERNLNIPVVFLSAYADFEYARQALLYSVKDYILKPVKHSKILTVFSTLKRELDATGNKLNLSEPIEGYYNKIIAIVKDYIVKNYKDASLELAALEVSLSPNYLSKIFKQQTGENFSDFLIQTKMVMASEMMNDINVKIYHISSAVGYDNPKNFSRAFKHYHGMSPREYRYLP
jgi:two-component system response regulator YesN